ncbi:hypothetical protein [Caballeronia glebae]|uniref:hypothetical protein n=1 Tax=Caballeronia glebae TaxID=1777143 RepID=UPI00117E090D|nr:hypothetical protein [Caballeronia glebae]
MAFKRASTDPLSDELIRLFVALTLPELNAFTFVYAEGDHNAVSDTGGHGGVQLLERSTNASPVQRFKTVLSTETTLHRVLRLFGRWRKAASLRMRCK